MNAPLGPLEAGLLDRLLGEEDARAAALHASRPTPAPISLVTVQSALKRLYYKGLVARWKDGHSYVFRVDRRRAALMAELGDRAMARFNGRRPEKRAAFCRGVLNAVAEQDLAALERFIEQERAARQS